MKLLLTVILAFIMTIVNSQDLISTGGDFFQMPSGSISFTIGEPIIETVGNENHIITQGFQQSSREITTGYDDLSDISINVFPNPTTDIINIELSEQRSLEYQLYDLNGVLLQEDKISWVQTSISLVNYAPSIYILKLGEANIGSKTFQIVKK